MNTNEKISTKKEVLSKIEEVLQNGYYEDDDTTTLLFPTSQKEIVDYLEYFYNATIVQATVSNYLKTLNYYKDSITGKYVKRNKKLYSEHRELLLSYLEIGDYTLKTLSKSKKNTLSIDTENLNTELLYELIKESYPKGHIQYMIKGYNILRVVVNKDYQPIPEYKNFPSFLDDIYLFAKKTVTPKMLKKKNREV